MQPITLNATLDGKTVSVETGKLAKQADGAVVVRLADTMVLVAAASAQGPREGIDFFPLTVDYQEKTFATGRIPGSYFRREGRPTEKEILTSRLIDRPCRPLFPDGYRNDTQVIATVVSMDRENDADVLALTGASAALVLSDIPFGGPIAGIRVGRIGGRFVANPTLAEREQSDIDVLMAASKDAIVMVEGGASQISETDMVSALMFGFEQVQPLNRLQEELRGKVGRPKRSFTKPSDDAKLKQDIKAIVYDRLKAAFGESDKQRRYGALHEAKEAVLAVMREKPWFAEREDEIERYVEDLKYQYMRSMILDQGVRIGGRRGDEVRTVTCEVGVLPRAHGSSLFTRGETQSLVATTLGTADDEQRVELLTGQTFKKFMLHYNFPPFSVGEVKPMRGPSRREIGHGALAERALKQVLPPNDKFPYTIRVVSEILESNGSSSMASVCGACLSLMDAGVPISGPVAGIAMGLIKEGEKVAILTDILGDEDHLGDMDFKVCGTRTGITAIQMDIKISGVSREILSRALDQARQGRLFVLERMASALAAPRPEINKYAPRITTIRIPVDRIRDVIGPGGKVIRDIIARTGCSIDVEDDGSVAIASSNQEQVEQAIRMIKDLTQEAEVGKNYMGTVRKITDFGAFVEIFPGTDGLLHISEISDKRIKQVSDVLKEGEEVLVKVLSVDRQGKIRLSRREAMPHSGSGEPRGAASTKGS